ncbi:hypothetical protein Pryu01_01513 [Paraliobacillus ryukyuensis]|uniref:Uncharacterized protein n=1 Tax=Paraliobacillus ryukyuensis TaxID=200904 RepID=A0A366EBV7_9BACI|nr:hypothetical protein [Paraliobacillus ryukyuensis]RBO99856.1 hypothetical protein DES48_103183 [Paraliobacillus ryukyuensis]
MRNVVGIMIVVILRMLMMGDLTATVIQYYVNALRKPVFGTTK